MEEEKKRILTISFFCNAMVLMSILGAIMLLAAFQTNFEILHMLFIFAVGTFIMVFLNIFLSSVYIRAEPQQKHLYSYPHPKDQ